MFSRQLPSRTVISAQISGIYPLQIYGQLSLHEVPARRQHQESKQEIQKSAAGGINADQGRRLRGKKEKEHIDAHIKKNRLIKHQAENKHFFPHGFMDCPEEEKNAYRKRERHEQIRKRIQ